MTMRQAEILGLLESFPGKKFDASQIQVRVGTNRAAINQALQSLRLVDMVMYDSVHCSTGYKYVYWVSERWARR